MDNNGILARHVPYGDTGPEDHFSASHDRMDHGMVQDRDIPVGNERPLDL